MRIVSFSVVLILIVFNSVFTQERKESNTNLPILKGLYFGQNPPKTTPELFAPDIISVKGYFEHSAAVFSPDNSEVYWSAKRNGDRYFKIYYRKIIDGKWTEQQIATFCDHDNYDNPVFSPDGNKLFFEFKADIWVVERSGNNWTEPIQISSVINTNAIEKMHSIMADGTIYFSRYNPNARIAEKSNEIFICRKLNGSYTHPKKLGENINSTDAIELSAYVASDESYMILEATQDRRMVELFISYKIKDDLWSQRLKLPFGWGRFPIVSPDGKYLFFMKRDGIYWVSTFFIDDLKPTKLIKKE